MKKIEEGRKKTLRRQNYENKKETLTKQAQNKVGRRQKENLEKIKGKKKT